MGVLIQYQFKKYWVNQNRYQLYIYLRTMKVRLAILLSLLVLGLTLSPEPVPTCSAPTERYKDFPISVQEVQTFNANEIFKGYNLNYTLVGAPDFVYMREKFKLFKANVKSQTGLKSYHLDHEDNHWGKKLVTLSENGDQTIVRWGQSTEIDGTPVLDEEVVVESDAKTKCYDAIWLRHEMLLMVDCARQAKFGLENVFLYVNTTSQKPLEKEVVNDMYVPFSFIHRRRMVHLEEEGENYIMRAYFADAVDEHFSHNTYIEIMLVNNPMRPWTIKVMDRSLLGQDRLSIMDFKLYLGDMYILCYHTGVISFDLTPAQKIVIKGRYRTDSGYHKLGVYSSNLDHERLLALANRHGIYEIDWTRQLAPKLIAKYSIMQDSIVTSLWVNEEYICAQIMANVSNAQSQPEEYHSTFVFDRGTRTYTNAYAVVPHSSDRTIIDLNLKNNLLFVIDENEMVTYQIDEPMIALYPTNPKDENKEFTFTIKATSANEYNGHSLVCSFSLTFIVVPIESMAIWPTGTTPPAAYYANYPGEMVVPLNRYVFGANITWGVDERVKDGDKPAWWILQQNDTLIHWDKEPSLMKITFLRKEQFEGMSQEFFFIYTQNAANETHIARCETFKYMQDVNCSEGSHQPHINYKIDNLTATFFLPNYGEFLHLAAVLYEEFPNEVFIYDVTKMEMFAKPIIMPGSQFEGQIQSIEYLGHYLAVVLRHIKTIVFYDMKKCADHQEKVCEEVFRIDSVMMDRLGVKYFSPLELYVSDFHPFVLFIHNVDGVIIVDISSEGPILLDFISSPASKEPGFWKWKMAITQGELILINPPNTIEEYNLDELYTRKITHLTKNFPVYHYHIPDHFQVDFSDQGDLLYITAVDPQLPEGMDSVILVYRAGLPAVASFYDVFHINGRYDDMLIDATGNFADYVSVAMGSILTMFRQYEIPVLVFEDTFNDFEFNLTFTNDAQGRYYYLTRSKVYIANYPETITVNDSKIEQDGFLSDQVHYEDQYLEVKLDDAGWFNGSVLNYSLEGCDECGSKLRVQNHVQEEREFYAETFMEDYVFTPQGGVIQQFDSLIKMQHNGSIEQISMFPSVHDGEFCRHIQHSWIYDYTLSACSHGDEVYLYTTTYTSFKPFVNGPFYSAAQDVASIHIEEDIMILVDVDEEPSKLSRTGGVIIYAMNHDPYDPEMFDELEFIDTDDLSHAPEWPGGRVYIGNAEIVYTGEADLYRLVITELKNGLFFVDFKWHRGRKSVEILKVDFVDMNKVLIAKDLHLPNLAFFEAVKVSNQYYDESFKYWEVELIVTTRNFHIFQVDLHIDKTGTILESKLAKVFYRYGFYETTNYIKTFDGYFAVAQKVPFIYEVYEHYSKQVLTVYDTRERWIFNETSGTEEPAPEHFYGDTDIPAAWMLGGEVFPKGRVTFDFNFTFTRNRTDPFRNIGLLAVDSFENTIRELRIHDHLKIIAEAGIGSNQDAVLRANNDYSSVDIPLSIVAGGLGGGAIVAIVIGCILVAIGGGYLIYRWNLKRQSAKGKDLEESLIDRDTLNVQEDEESSEQEDDEDSDEDEDEDDDEDQQEEEEQGEEQEQPEKPVQSEPVAEEPRPEAINDSVASEPKPESSEPQVEESKPQEAEAEATEAKQDEKKDEE